MFMRKISGIFPLILASILFAGCAVDQEDASINKNQNLQVGELGTEILTYGYIDAYSHQDMPDTVKERIVTFNQSQDEYFIEIIKYGEDSYKDGLNALNADISAGRGPDILEIANEELLYQFGRKGIIEDLYPYLDGGEWPGREDFVDNILENFETDGKLYGMVPFFKIMSLIANPVCINVDKVTFSQLKEMYEENRENGEIEVYNGLTKSYLLYYCIIPSIENFVDMQSHTCNFVNDDFIQLLEFSAQFDDNYMGNYDQLFEDYDKLQEGKMYLFFNGPIGSFLEYTHYRALMGESAPLIGFPSVTGCGPRINTNSSYLAINSKSKHKNAAWQFICTFLEDRYQAGRDNYAANVGFPVTESGFDLIIKKVVEDNTTLDTEGNVIPKDNSVTYSSPKGEERTYPVCPPTDEEVAYIREVISKAEAGDDYGQIEAIVSEEIENYWNGTKTVQEVVEVIQNRSQLYLNEL